jgi:anti-sigma factor RsiW
VSDVPRGEAPLQDGHWQEEQLTAHLLGELPEAETEALDAHLARCARCRATMERLNEAWVGSVERLEAPPPRDEVWRGIAQRVQKRGREASTGTAAAKAPPVGREGRTAAPPPRGRPAPMRGFAAGMVALLLVVSAGAWGAWQRQVAREAQAEADALQARLQVLESVVGTVQARADGLASDQARVARWLAREDVRTARLPAGEDGVPIGSVLFEPGGRALVVMRELPAEGRDFQAWGVAGGEVTSLGAFTGRTAEVDAAAFEAVAVSLEPDGGSPEPTNVLGAAGRG